MTDRIIHAALQELFEISDDPVVQERIRMREKAELDWGTYLADVRLKGYESGRAEGLIAGKAEGKAEAIMTLLRSPMFAGVSDAEIAAILQMSESEIAALRRIV
jgi:hypothetical protein